MNVRETIDNSFGMFLQDKDNLIYLNIREKCIKGIEQCLPSVDELVFVYEKVRWEQTKKSFSGKSVYSVKERMEAIHSLMVKKIIGEGK